MRIAIVDDERVFREQISKSILSLYGSDAVSCFHYADGTDFIKSIKTGFEPDAVFLDIEMKEMDGMETARLIRETSKDIPIVFMTSHTEMAMEGYEVNAFRFLSKPVDLVKLRETLKELENRIRVEEKIILKVEGEEVVHPVSSLLYVEASNNSSRFVFTDSETEIRMKFTDAMKLVDGSSSDFFRCHRSYHINMGRVKKLGTSEVYMDNGDVIPVSRSTAPAVKQKLFEFIRRNGR